MKGLFIKDLELLGANRRFLLTYLMLVIVLGIYNPAFAITYLFILTASFAARTISYDEKGHGLLYIFSWPVSRRDYVVEKYALCLGLSLLVSLAAGGILFFLDQISYGDLLVTLASGWITSTVFISIFIPVELKYGTEKSGLVILLLAALMGASIYFLYETGFASPVFQSVVLLRTEVLLLVLCALFLVEILASMLISIRILNRKEF